MYLIISHRILNRVLRCVIYLSLLVFITCTEKSLTPQDYLKYYKNNSKTFSKTIERNGAVAEIAYQPAELYAARELEADSTKSLDKILDKYRNSFFVKVTVKDTGHNYRPVLHRGGPGNYKSNLYNALFDKEKDALIYADMDTIRAEESIFAHEDRSGMSDSFVLIFDRTRMDPDRDYKLLIRDMDIRLGTLELGVNEIVKNNKIKLRG